MNSQLEFNWVASLGISNKLDDKSNVNMPYWMVADKSNVNMPYWMVAGFSAGKESNFI